MIFDIESSVAIYSKITQLFIYIFPVSMYVGSSQVKRNFSSLSLSLSLSSLINLLSFFCLSQFRTVLWTVCSYFTRVNSPLLLRNLYLGHSSTWWRVDNLCACSTVARNRQEYRKDFTYSHVNKRLVVIKNLFLFTRRIYVPSNPCT